MNKTKKLPEPTFLNPAFAIQYALARRKAFKNADPEIDSYVTLAKRRIESGYAEASEYKKLITLCAKAKQYEKTEELRSLYVLAVIKAVENDCKPKGEPTWEQLAHNLSELANLFSEIDLNDSGAEKLATVVITAYNKMVKINPKKELVSGWESEAVKQMKRNVEFLLLKCKNGHGNVIALVALISFLRDTTGKMNEAIVGAVIERFNGAEVPEKKKIAWAMNDFFKNGLEYVEFKELGRAGNYKISDAEEIGRYTRISAILTA
ncbi:MAG: hypothetical protein WCT31_04900 [Candidatus Micrarchaeia archaeon]